MKFLERFGTFVFPQVSFDRKVLEEIYAIGQESLDDMAVPSYLSKNFLIRWIIRRRMCLAVRLLEFRPGEVILDFGCGTGVFFLQLPYQMGNYYGVDIVLWPAEMSLSHHKRDDVILLRADSWMTTIPDHSLDKIVAIEVLEHIQEIKDILSIFKQKLKPGGKLIVSGPTENTIYRIGRKIAGFSGDYHKFDIHQILKDILAAGFRVEQKISIPLPGPLSLFILLRFNV